MDKLLLGLSTTAVGMLVVFFGLAILIGCIMVMGMIFGKKKEPKKEVAPQNMPAAAPEAIVEEAAEESDDAIIAAITAALVCVWDKKDTGFVVRRVRRIPSAASWQTAARDEQMFNRM